MEFEIKSKRYSSDCLENYSKTRGLGDLGVGDMVIKNVALLFKWCWRYSDRGMPLWKRIFYFNQGITLDVYF